MIKSLTLKNFRKHADLHIDFSTGLNVLRGANEAGKSTVWEGLLYALYGTKSLRNTLADTVSWGHKENELSARAVINVSGRDYTFTRSKAGAEVNFADANGGLLKVAGHAEVSTYAAGLLGADAKTASLLMLSSQSGLRGALDDGPAAVSGLMSKLADFDLIDRIVETAQARLLLGSEAPFSAKLAEAETEHRDLGASAPAAALHEGLALQIDHAAADLQGKQVGLVASETAFKDAERAVVAAIQANEKRDAAQRSCDALLLQVAAVENDRLAAVAASTVRPAPEALAAAKQRVTDETNHGELMAAWKAVTGLPAYPAVFWDEPRESFDAEVARLQKAEATLVSDASAALAAAQAIRKNKITSGKCPTCGHAARSDEHVEEHNDALDAQAKEHDRLRARYLNEKAALGSDISAMAGIKRLSETYEQVRRTFENRGFPVTVDESVVPPRISWTNGEPGQPDLAGARTALAELERQAHAAVQAEGRAAALQSQVATLARQRGEAEALVASLPPADATPLQQAFNEALRVYSAAKEALELGKVSLQQREAEYRDAKQLFDRHAERMADATRRIDECQRDLKALAFNNVLVKKLRGLKPAITDQLWNSVLAAVSNFFSTLRGEASVVSKEANGFKVNGQSIESLSGSTIDVLALAVRVALTKTFIPHATFMVLDEPAHGCDNTRTGNVLGFLSSVGFAQTLLASHDELSESVADNVISLGD